MPSKNKTGRRGISADEKARRQQQRQQSLAAIEQLLYSRAMTAHALGDISVASVIRLENRKLLDKVRHTPKGEVFHRVSQVRQLAQGGYTES